MEVDTVSKKGFEGPDRKQDRGRRQCSHSGGKTKHRNCGSSHPPRRCPAYGKECSLCKKKGHFKQFCRSSHQNRYKSHSSDNRKSRRDMHDVDQQEDELFQLEDYDSVNVRTVRFTTDVHNNIAFNEISGGGRRATV